MLPDALVYEESLFWFCPMLDRREVEFLGLITMAGRPSHRISAMLSELSAQSNHAGVAHYCIRANPHRICANPPSVRVRFRTHEPGAFKHCARKRPLKDSVKPFWVGLPGAM